MHMTIDNRGPRQNSVFEGLSFADNYKTLYVSVEEPLLEDGEPADVNKKNALVRILRFDAASHANTAQYAYPLDPVAYAANPPGAYKINGVPEILSLENDRLLVMERSYSTGRLACVVKLFIADFTHATDIKNISSLKNNTGFVSAEKKLLLNLEDLGVYIDNLEGMSFGPRLSNGHRSLILVSDNNFSPLQKTQFLLFEVLE